MNENEELMKLLKTKQYEELWERVKYVGYPLIKNMFDRQIFFYDCLDKIDVNGENFIRQYLQQMQKFIHDMRNKGFFTNKRFLREGI